MLKNLLKNWKIMFFFESVKKIYHPPTHNHYSDVIMYNHSVISQGIVTCRGMIDLWTTREEKKITKN